MARDDPFFLLLSRVEQGDASALDIERIRYILREGYQSGRFNIHTYESLVKYVDELCKKESNNECN